MAGDTMVTADGVVSYSQKVFRIQDGSLVGVFGHMAFAYDILRWLTGELVNPPDKIQDAGVLVLKPDGRVFEYDGHFRPIEHLGKFVCAGSGSATCYGALEAGATLKRAVEIACMRTAGCGGEITIMKLRRSEAKRIAKPRRK